jgi:hypothetical protein
MSSASLHRKRRGDLAAPSAAQPGRRRRDRVAPEPELLEKLAVPGWPKRGRFKLKDLIRLVVALAWLPRLIEDFVDGVHYDGAEPMPWGEKLRGAYADDALAFTLHYLSHIVLSRSSPVFLVAHAWLRTAGFYLHKRPAVARSNLKRLFARCSREQRAAPDAQPDEAGKTCLEHPTIAILASRRTRAFRASNGRARSMY